MLQAPYSPRRLRFGFGVVIASLLTLPLLLGLQEAPRSSRELVLSDFQDSHLKADLPAHAIAFGGQQSLWIAGKKQLWHWDVSDKHLAEVKLPDPAPLRQLLSKGSRLYAASDRHLWTVDEAPLRVLRYELPTPEGEGRSLGLSLHDGRLHWLRSDGVYDFEEGRKQSLRLWHAQKAVQEEGPHLLLVEEGKLWWLADSRLLELKLATGEERELFKTSDPLTGLQGEGAHILVHTRHTLLQFSRRGELIRTIPVEGQRELVRMDLSAVQHSYPFHDRLFESHLLAAKSSQHAFLDLGRVKKAGPMLSRGSFVAFLLDGQPRAFQLEGNW